MENILEHLTDILEQRKHADPDNSYVSQLHTKGLDIILQKVGEEATETILAAKSYQTEKIRGEDSTQQRTAWIGEVADLWFHSLVMLSHLDANADDVLKELAKRSGMSGLDEKAARTSK